MQQSRFLAWAQGLYIAGLALGLLFIIPSAWFPLQLGKVTLASLCFALAAIFFALSGGARVYFRGQSLRILGAMALLPIAYLISLATSVDRSVGFTGYAVEADTIVFVVLCYLVFVLGYGLFRNPYSGRLMLMSAGVVAAIAAVFQFVVLVAGGKVLSPVFADHSVNLVGKWNDLGLLIGLLFVLTLIVIEFASVSNARRIGAWVLGGVLLLLLAVVQFPLVWSLLLGFSLVVAAWSFVNKRSDAPLTQRLPWAPLVSAVLTGLLLLWGSAVNLGLTGIFPVSALEVRPSVTSTLDMVRAAHGSSMERFLLGTGPMTFGQEWQQLKPASVNQSPFWNLDFNVGFSTFTTALLSVGVLGALAWLVPLLLLFLALLSAIRAGLGERERLVAVTLGLSAIYLWGGILFYVFSEDMLLLSFALAAAALGVAARRSEEAVPSRRTVQGAVAFALVVAVLFVCGTAVVGRRALAEAYTNQGLVSLQQGDADGALGAATSAQRVEKTGDNLRLSVDAGLLKLQQIAGSKSGSPQDLQQQFASAAQSTISAGQAALALNPGDYRSYVSLGHVYDYMASLNINGAYENAKAAYQSAGKQNPTNPQIPLLLSRLEAVHGNTQGVTTYLQQALTMKPDYTDAILFLVQLDVLNKDIPSAVKAAQAAVQSAPGVPSLWFELGLLYYSANDTADAIAPLERAVQLEPDYANAKYFLGLSYAAQNRTQDAVKQFTDLAESNPDNQEVKLILSNLQAGKSPFQGAQPPVTSTPQDRSTAPISQ